MKPYKTYAKKKRREYLNSIDWFEEKTDPKQDQADPEKVPDKDQADQSAEEE
jgi:hypothetical protein